MKTLFSFAKCLSSNKEVGSALARRNNLLNLFSSAQFALIPEANFSKAGGEVFYGPIKGFYKAGFPRITDDSDFTGAEWAVLCRRECWAT